EITSHHELRHIFLHELAHLKRHDIQLGWLTSLLQVLHWFNPLVWFAFHRMRADRELACDGLVLSAMKADEPQQYGQTIVNLLERFSQPRYLPGMAGILENKAQLKRRISMIAGFKKNPRRWSIAAILLFAVLSCVALTDGHPVRKAFKSINQAVPPSMHDHLVLYYSFDQDERIKIVDISGKNNHAQVHGPKSTKDGIAGGALYFDGQDDFISVPDIHLGKFSFAAWVNTFDTEGQINNRRLLLLDDGNNNYFAIEGNSRGAVSVDTTGHKEINEYDWQFEFDTWTHIAVTHNGNNFRIYKNGELTETGDINTNSVRGIAYIGGIDNYNGGFWHGKMDEVALFNRALSPLEVKNLCKQTLTTSTTGKDRQTKQHAEYSEDLGSDVILEMVKIPSGTFQMGSPPAEPDRQKDEGPLHSVKLHGFWIGKYEVTVDQFRKFVYETDYQTEGEKQGWAWATYGSMGWEKKNGINWHNPPFPQSDRDPVICVTYNDAMAFCKWLSGKTGKKYTLPTEAQWEYACRAGSTSRFFFGDSRNDLEKYACYNTKRDTKTHPAIKKRSGDPHSRVNETSSLRDNSYPQHTDKFEGKTLPVGTKEPNDFGLYDTYGNLWEWCLDWYDDNYYSHSPKKNPKGPDRGTSRVLRGGSWACPSKQCRSAVRAGSSSPTQVHSTHGFRVVCVSKVQNFIYTSRKSTDDKAFFKTVDLTFRTPNDLDQLVISGGDWKVEDNQLIATCPDGNNWATYKTSYKKISSVLIRGKIVLPGYQEFRIWVGPIHLIFNWECALQNHYRNQTRLTRTKHYALTPGKWQDIELKQYKNMVVVSVDDKVVYTTEATLQGTVSVQAAVNSTIAVKNIRITGQPDPTVNVPPLKQEIPTGPQPAPRNWRVPYGKKYTHTQALSKSKPEWITSDLPGEHKGYALQFDGKNDYIYIKNSKSLDIRGSVTLSAWVKNNGDNDGQIIWRGDELPGHDPYQLHLTHGKMECRINVGDGKMGYIIQSKQAVDNNWHFWTGVYDKEAGKLYLYKDGNLDNSTDTHLEINYDTSSMWNTIGAVDHGNWQHFNGVIDEARIWNMARTPQQIKKDMNRSLTGKEKGLVAYWKLDEGKGNIAKDSSPNNNHGKASLIDTSCIEPEANELAEITSLNFKSKEDLNNFVISGGNWKVENNELVGYCTGDRSWATYNTYYKCLNSVLIRGKIVPPNTQNLRTMVGPIHLIFNWEIRNENHYRNYDKCTVTSPHALIPGKWHDIKFTQQARNVIVTVDDRQVYKTQAILQGTISIQAALGSTVAIESILISGQPDPSVKVEPETRGLPRDSRMPQSHGPRPSVAPPHQQKPFPKGTTLKHDDGTADGKRSLAASGHAVAFERPQNTRFVEAVQIFASRYGHQQPPQEDFHLYLIDSKRQILTDLRYPYSMIERGDLKWYTLRTPSIEVAEGYFKVALAFNPHQTKGIYLGLDETGEHTRSFTGLPDIGYDMLDGGYNWMIRVHLTQKPSGEKGIQRLADWKPPLITNPFGYCIPIPHVIEVSEHKQSYGGRGPARQFNLAHFDLLTPASDFSYKNIFLKGFRIYASRYGSGYDPEKTYVNAAVLDSDNSVRWEGKFPYALFSYKPKWVDLVLQKPVALADLMNEDRMLTFAFNPEAHRTKGIYFHYHKDPPTSNSLVGTVADGFKPIPDREWIVRAYFESKINKTK
ncbi:MAG: SUMF1/EgtB/PvdO family nonheme iron enzyme, partial [Planctomycetota bacterium]